MAKDNGTNISPEMNLGDLGMIRNILVGPQMTAIEERITALEKELSSRTADIQKDIENLDKKSSKAIETLEKSSGANMEKIERQIEKRLDQLSRQLEDTSAKDKARIGKMLSDMGKKLMDS